ncbi:MAG TPA: YkvA family protein [Anaerolineae bacterium]|nr:YkvA family protein [Anaerolineae bacterium]
MRGDRRSPSFWTALIRQLRLAWRLFRDPRVPLAAKLVPLIAVVYILSPIDFLPDWFIGLGQLDDLTIFILGLQIFAKICPPAVVEAILREMDDGAIEGEWRRSRRDRPDSPRLPKSDR